MKRVPGSSILRPAAARPSQRAARRGGFQTRGAGFAAWFAIAVAAALFAGIVAAPRPATAQEPVFRTSADRVRIDALVTRGRTPVIGLTADDFEVFDNGVRQKVDLSTTARNVTAALLLDVSGSVEGETLSRLGDAVRAFSGALVPGDTASLVSFSRRLKLDALSVADPLAIRQALGGARAAGATAMWDALVAGAALVQDAPSPPLVVIFTDGADTYSYLDQKKASECLDRATAVVYAVRASRLAPPPALLQSGANVTIIDQPGDMLLAMASRTGGAVWPAAEGTDLSGQFVRVLQEFRSRYLLIYEPTGVRRDDGWHQVKVRVKDGRAEVKARPGYYATRREGGTTDSQGARR